MDVLFTVCIVIGIVMPLLSIIGGTMGSVLDALHIDFHVDMDVGHTGLTLFPTSGMSLCAGLLVFGTVGKIADHNFTGYLLIIVAAIGGYITAVFIQNLIRVLRRSEVEVKSKEDLKGIVCTVVLSIPTTGYGKISLNNDGSNVTYTAKSLNGETIPQNENVMISRFDGDTAIVYRQQENELEVANILD